MAATSKTDVKTALDAYRDTRRTDPAKLRTILRQPVERSTAG